MSISSFIDHYSRPHWPDVSVLSTVSPAIQVHLLAAVIAFAVATLQILGPKGTAFHRIVGWGWVIVMFTVAVSSFFIRQINHGTVSFIHILSGLTLIALPLLVLAARRGDIKRYRKEAYSLYIGALLIAGLFTFLPGRLMWEMFFG
jgi:uncharacterized membrane protein